MARDLPDWGALTAQATVHEVTDLGELAVRLGSIVSHDRQGDVLWLDCFECGLGKWSTSALGTGASVALATDRARNGETSVKLTSRSDGQGAPDIRHSNPYPPASKLGCEYSFNLGTAIDSMLLSFYVYDGSVETGFVVWWNEVAETLSYSDVSGNPVVFATGVKLYRSDSLFHTMKLVVDAATREYVRFIVDHREYSLDGIAGINGGSTARYNTRTIIQLVGRSNQNDIVYVDDAILTQNEPANA